MGPKRQLSKLTINLDYLNDNIEELRALHSQKSILFMVKADAYGHGLLPIVQFSYERAGIKSFGVASLKEALEIRKELPEVLCDLYVFSEIALDLENNIELYSNNRIYPVISCHEDLDSYLIHDDFKFFPLCIKFNTGMNRLGFECSDVSKVSQKLLEKGRNEIFHLMSHFANASMPLEKNKRNIQQKNAFENVKEELLKSGISFLHSSIANSASLEQGYVSEDDFIRPGLMLYGASSLAPQYRDLSKWKGKSISQLETTVLKVFSVKKGDPLSYASTPCPDDGVAAIIPLGYGDGISTRYQGARLDFGVETGHICARVCMDMMTVLFSKDSSIKVHDQLKIWEHKAGSLNAVSEEVKVIPYELVIQLTSRLPRNYVSLN